MASDISDELIDQTLAVWQPRSARRLTREDARQIVENIAGFFQVLARWDQVARQATMAASTVEMPNGDDERTPIQGGQRGHA